MAAQGKMDGSSNCVLCRCEFTDTNSAVVVHQKGLATLVRVSKKRKDYDLKNYLKQIEETGEKVLVHHDCRRRFVDKRKKCDKESFPVKRLRSCLEISFNWKLHCFICGETADWRHKDRDKVKKVMTVNLRATLIKHAQGRGDQLGDAVLGHLESCNELVAEKAVYHASCMANFILKKPGTKKKGRPVDLDMADNFNKLCTWLEETSDCEMYTLKDFHDKMYELSDSKCIYSERRLKQKLKDHFKEHIYFTEFPGKADVICFRDTASHIIYNLKNKPVETKEDVIIAAAKIIRLELRELRKTSVIQTDAHV